jgi:hypothetical protein
MILENLFNTIVIARLDFLEEVDYNNGKEG